MTAPTLTADVRNGIDYKVADLGLAEFGRKEIRLAEHVEYAQILDPFDLPHLCLDLRGQVLQYRQIGADDLRRVGAFDAGQALLDIVLDVLREVEVDADELLGEFGL